MNRREFLAVSAAAAGVTAFAEDRKAAGYNVLFIAIDDLNDWVGCLGGNPQARTPNMDRLHAEGGMVMQNAYCPATVCNPSRAAILTGLRPSATGVYGNTHNLKYAPKAQNAVTLTEYFSANGYHTLSRGKIFHKHPSMDGMDEGQWAYDEFSYTSGSTGLGSGQMPLNDLPMPDGSPAKGKALAFDWGPTKVPLEETRDYLTASWAAQQLERDFEKPFFMAVGISKPHLAWYVPPEFFEMYPLDEVKVPLINEEDYDDILDEEGERVFEPSTDYLRVKKYGRVREAARAYLAAVSYADTCVGAVLDALDKSSYRDNTIVVLWGDHGWYLGEKLRYRKTHLWQESTRVPLIFKVPGVTGPDSRCDRVVNLIDLYPTLVDLCGLPPNPANHGRNFAPLLHDPQKEWDYPALVTMGYKNHAVINEDYHFIYHGTKNAIELYDRTADPMQWRNIAGSPEYFPIIQKMRQHLPEHNEPEAPANVIPKKALRVFQRKKDLLREFAASNSDGEKENLLERIKGLDEKLAHRKIQLVSEKNAAAKQFQSLERSLQGKSEAAMQQSSERLRKLEEKLRTAEELLKNFDKLSEKYPTPRG